MIFRIQIAFVLTLGWAHAQGLEISRPARHWEFFNAVGDRAAVLGRESGTFEAWVYPLKVLSDFRLEFTLNGRLIPAEAVARSVVYRPGSSTLIYSGDYYEEHFLVRQVFVAPPAQTGVVILLEIEASAPLKIDAIFKRDFTLMWPAGLGGTFGSWDEQLKAVVMGEEQRRFFGLVGSPDATLLQREYATNYSANPETALSLGTVEGTARRTIVVAASFESRQELAALYRVLVAGASRIQQETVLHYQQYLTRTVRVDLPDKAIETAYDWSLISMRKGLVTNPFLPGRGLVAGFGLSKGEPRPGFAWFFGRDTFWSVLALTASGDFETARDAIQFIAQFQRQDGKIPHEISQSASFIPWFEDYPYAYASADSTSLYIIAVADYVRSSGDLAFVDECWDRLNRAASFLKSTQDENGFARNQGVGHGWVEGGPLLPVKTEFYQASLHVEALRALGELSALKGQTGDADSFKNEFDNKRDKLNQVYWLPEADRYAFAIGVDGKPIDQPSALSTVPMWFGLTDPEKSILMIPQLAGEDHLSDWGSRLVSSQSSLYKPAGYHFGSVWPLFTGWASVGQYRYHQTGPALANLLANAALALDGSGGHTTEVVSGAAYSPLSTSSSHQIWSAAMVVSPLLRGLFGLDLNAPGQAIALGPHLPASWNRFAMSNLPVGKGKVSLEFERDESMFSLRVRNAGSPVKLLFSPAIAPRARLLSAELGGRPISWKRVNGVGDSHPEFAFEAPNGEVELKVLIQGDFAVSAEAGLPVFGQPSSNLKVISQLWDEDGSTLRLKVAGMVGRDYRMSVFGGSQVISVSGAELTQRGAALAVRFSTESGSGYRQRVIEIKLKKPSG